MNAHDFTTEIKVRLLRENGTGSAWGFEVFSAV